MCIFTRDSPNNDNSLLIFFRFFFLFRLWRRSKSDRPSGRLSIKERKRVRARDSSLGRGRLLNDSEPREEERERPVLSDRVPLWTISPTHTNNHHHVTYKIKSIPPPPLVREQFRWKIRLFQIYGLGLACFWIAVVHGPRLTASRHCYFAQLDLKSKFTIGWKI